VNQPPLADVAALAAHRAPDAATVAALADALVHVVGSSQVSTVEAVRRAASTDFAHLSPLLPAVLPERPADVVVYPRGASDVVAAVRLAHTLGVPVTPRGRGTGNYGQAVPLAGGLVIDLSRCERVLEVGDRWIRAEAGASFVALEAAARQRGQELAMLPTTMGSTIGGFLAGGAGGLGSIEHGWLWDGFALSLDIVTCPPGDGPVTVHGGRCVPYLHAYGVTGIITAATVRLAPARDWVGLLASYPAGDGSGAVQAGLALLRLDPPPRLVSLDEPDLVATYPDDPAMPPGRHSLRAIVDSGAVEAAGATIAAHGGRVEAVRADGATHLATFAFNHVTLRARRARPDLVHLQVSGEALVREPEAVRATLPAAMLHLDGLRLHLDRADPARGRHFGGLILSRFIDAATLYEGIARLAELGVHVVDPHSWLLGGPALVDIQAQAARNDPDGLLNPGRLPPS
jgi:FAD/FMN-containing dehydrogenase